jgi:hypothetical protein
MNHCVEVVAAEQVEHFPAPRELHGLDGDQVTQVA